MPLSFTDQQIDDEAVRLGLIGDGEDLPRHQRSRVVAVLAQQENSAKAPAPERAPQLAREVVIDPSGPIHVDGQPFPWFVGAEPMDIRLDPDGTSTVRLTLLTESLIVTRPEPRPESE